MHKLARFPLATLWFVIALIPLPLPAQETSVRPGINDYYMDPEWEQWVRQFERPGREVFDRRFEIVEASRIFTGMAVADIGAGTGLYTRLFAERVGPQGRVYAVDISGPFVDNILRISRDLGQNNVRGITNTARDTLLPPDSIDLAFTVDTYHHFEYPQDMLASIHRALRPNGRMIIIDFRKNPGLSSNWVMGHVRANRLRVIDEVVAAGFRLIDDKPMLRTNYFLEFVKE